MTSKYDTSIEVGLAIFVLLLLSISEPIFAKVGLNCTGGDDCDERVPCPPASVVDKISGKCVCNPDHCTTPPQCRYSTKFVIKHNATKQPGDCCNIYECIKPAEVNCTGVICPDYNITCPVDSLSLPWRHVEGECCSTPGGCECLPPPCPVPECQEGTKEKVIQTGTNEPGSCCPVYECQTYEAARDTCRHEGRDVADGHRWKRGKCLDCVCTKGDIQCSIVSCPKDCHITNRSLEDCCPLCKRVPITFDDKVMEPASPGGCKSGRGELVMNEQTWFEDECTKCTCINGESKCQAAFCITQPCLNATWVKGECCPRCNGTSVARVPNCPQTFNCNLSCKNGFARDAANCFLCKCKEDDCNLHCPNGYIKDENDEELCECVEQEEKTSHCPPFINCLKKCKYGYKMNKAGCTLCRCYHPCKIIDHNCKKNCPHGLQTDHKGCPICKCRASAYVTDTLDTYEHIENNCNTDTDVWRDNGEQWNDGCRQCYCHKGREMCALIACPKLDCPDPVITKKYCCPTCPGNDTKLATQVVCYGPDGLLKLEGESWSVGCVDCICHGGRVMCNREVCPPAPCAHPLPPLPGKCCPRCTTEMQPDVTSLQGCGVDRPAGSSWREGNCVSCICANGIASCFTESCHQVDITCKRPLQVKNLCCSICLDGGLHDETTCHVGNVTFNLGDEWEPDKCKRCTCEQGRTVSCIQTLCENPCTKNGDNPCCPNCKDAEGSSGSYAVFLYIFLLCALMCLCGAGMVVVGRSCRLRRDQLKICQQHPTTYPYKYVPAFDGPTPQTSPLTLKSPV